MRRSNVNTSSASRFFLIDCNLPFSLSSKLTKLIKDVSRLHSVEAFSKFSFDEKNAKIWASDKILPILKDRYLKRLEETPFCILADATSNGNIEYLTVSARFFQTTEDLVPSSKLIALIEIEESITGELVFGKIGNFSSRIRRREGGTLLESLKMEQGT